MDAAQAAQYLTSNHRAVMATFRRDGRPAMSPVTVAVDEQGRVCVSTRQTAMKVKHLRRDPRVAITAFPDEFYGEWVQVEGSAEIVELPDAMPLLVDYYRSVSGEDHPDWDEYRQAMTDEQRVIVRFDIERAGPNVTG
ncbi:PPOX class F420-dependent oxidoreductase [uncultured Jatrophihabitans sp.]|uniref:PPOX class F420-dependent oxidoreductase n=1 Tax=uncultured Jatrophihabitans sp. TaxID=1610747 RepID=UPI0035CB66E1